MTGVQSRDESAEDSSDEQPLSTLIKSKKAAERTQIDETFGSAKMEQSSDASQKETPAEAAADDHEPPAHSSDDEPVSKLIKRKRTSPASTAKDRRQKSAVRETSDSEDDKPLMMVIKKKKKAGKEGSTAQDAKKTQSPQKRTLAAKVSKSSSPRAKTPQKRGQKGKEGSKSRASVHSSAEKPTPKRRGRPKKADRETKASSNDSSDDEPLIHLVKKKRELEMKQAVVLLKRMSERDVIDVTQGRARCREQSHKAGADESESSDEEPLSHKVKRLKQQSKPAKVRGTADASSDDEPLMKTKAAQVKGACRGRTNGEEDTPKQKVAEESKGDSGRAERTLDEADHSSHTEPSSS